MVVIMKTGGEDSRNQGFMKGGARENSPPPRGGHRLVSRKEWLQKKESCGKGRVTGKNVVEKMRVMILGWAGRIEDVLVDVFSTFISRESIVGLVGWSAMRPL